MHAMRNFCLGTLAFALGSPALAREPNVKHPLAIEDLYRLEGPQSVALSPDNRRAAVVRRWVDPTSKEERFALWLVEDGAAAKGDQAAAQAARGTPAETGEPDARWPVFSPDGRWMAIRSTRPRPEGWKQTPAAAPESDAATDIWLVSADGKQVLPLAGRDKPYGRVLADPFYGRVTFSPDGKRLAFVADDGRDPRTPEELDADVQIVRPDQGEGYTGYGVAQVWLAELDPSPHEQAARSIRRLTSDDIWYGDPQWTPDGRELVCHANKSGDVEAVRYSINKNFDLWAIDVATGRQRQLTVGPGPEVSPRISPDGSRLACLSSPRKGPHADVFNLMVVPLKTNSEQPTARVLFDHHGGDAARAPHPTPSFPLPDECWDGGNFLAYNSAKGTGNEAVRVDVTTGKGTVEGPSASEPNPSPRQIRNAARRRLTPPTNPILDARVIAEEEIFAWQSDGQRVEGVLTLPPKTAGAAPYPLVVYPHGGPHGRSTQAFNFTAQFLAGQGYLVFQPNFRGSSGYGRAFLDADRKDLGGGDMRDVLTGIEALIARQLVDRNRQFVYGSSYGGYMTSWLVGHTRQFRAAVAQNAVTDMHVMWGAGDLQSWTEWELGGRPWEVAAAMRRHSPISYVDQVATPTLVLHCREDRRCPLPMGRMLYQSLIARSVPTQMVIYPNEGHAIRQPRHQADALRRIVAWFRQHDVKRGQGEGAP